MSEIENPQQATAKVSQSNELTEAAYYLPLPAKRVLWMYLMHLYKLHESQQDASELFTVDVGEYQSLFGATKQRASADVKRGVLELATNLVTFFPKEGDMEEVHRPWLIESGVKRGRGKWVVEFNPRIMPYIHGLTSQFTTYSIMDCGKITSVRAIRLYESLCQFRSSGIWVTTPARIANRFMLPSSQRENIAEMKRTFLTPALKKINQHTPLLAEMSQDDNGKLIFTIVEKTGK